MLDSNNESSKPQDDILDKRVSRRRVLKAFAAGALGFAAAKKVAHEIKESGKENPEENLRRTFLGVFLAIDPERKPDFSKSAEEFRMFKTNNKVYLLTLEKTYNTKGHKFVSNQNLFDYVMRLRIDSNYNSTQYNMNFGPKMTEFISPTSEEKTSNGLYDWGKKSVFDLGIEYVEPTSDQIKYLTTQLGNDFSRRTSTKVFEPSEPRP